MISELKKQFDEINANIEVLPTNNAKNVEKFAEYLDMNIEKYKGLLKDAENEIKSRYNETLEKYKNLTFEAINVDVDYNSFRLSDERIDSMEKMNLPYLFYRLRNLSDNNLSEVNKIILEIVNSFKDVGIVVDESMFNISENVNVYMKALLSNAENIQDIFNSIYWKTSDILSQIELNFRYIFNKNKNTIDEFFKKKYANFDFRKFLSSHRDLVNQAELAKHSSIKYLYDLFMDGTYVIDDFISESSVQNLFNKVIVDKESDRNYECLIKLKKTLLEYRGYKEFEYIIKDFKELYTHKEEYKDLYSNKLKEIEKKEDLIVVYNKKINKKGFFKLNKNKLESTQNERNKVITELINDYNELDSLKIKDDIYNFVNEDTDLYNILVFTSYNFEYFVHLLGVNNEELTVVNIDKNILKLKKFIYDNYIDILNNILISEDKSLEKIIVDMYKLNSILLSEDDLALDQINKYLEYVDKLLVYFDVYTVMLNLKDIDFILKAPAILNK